jgi:hypothetical protein
MKTATRYSHGRVTYTGRVAKASFDAWAESADGRPVLDAVVSRVRFAPFGRRRAAGRRLWRQLNQAAQTDAVAVGVQHEAEAYLARLDKLVYANDLPHVGVHLRRLVVVPRVLVNAEAYRRIDAILQAQPAFAALEGAPLLRSWFSLMLVDGIAAAVAAARPSPRRPAPAGEGWITVGINEAFQWRIPLEGPRWPGHYYVLELTRTPMTRAVRKAAGEAIARLESSLSALSRSHRHEILRQAQSSLEQLLARA